MATSLVINTIDHLTDAAQTKTISNINPAVSDSYLGEWAQMGSALSKDTLASIERVDRNTIGKTKTARVGFFQANAFVNGATVNNTRIENLDEFSIDINTLTAARSNTRWLLNISYDTASGAERGEQIGTAYISSDAADFTPNYTATWAGVGSINKNYVISVALHEKVARDVTITFHLPETDSFAPWDKTWLIHFVDGGE